MHATFITTALDNGASLEDVQRAAGHADPSTTKLYDRRGYNPEKSASFFADQVTSSITCISVYETHQLCKNETWICEMSVWFLAAFGDKCESHGVDCHRPSCAPPIRLPA